MKISAIYKKLDFIIWQICYYWLIIDTFTGYFLNAGVQMPFSQLIKSSLLVCLILRLIHNRKIALLIASIIILFTIIYISSAFIYYPFSGTLTHFSKLLLTILLFVYFKREIIQDDQDKFQRKALKIFKIGLIVLFINAYIGLLGLGYHTYERDQYGYKGYIYSGNEIGGLIVVMVPVLLYYCFFKFNKKIYIFAAIVSLIFGLLVSTKAGILIIIISIFGIPYIYSNPKIRKKIALSSIIFLCIGIYLIANIIDISSSNFLEQIFYRYNTGGLILVLLSARNDFVSIQYQLFEAAPMFQKIFGIGIGTKGLITVEMDYFDALFYYGYFGLCIMFVITFLLFKSIKTNYNNNRMIPTILLSDILMVLMATIAGHIIFSSMAGLYIALLNSLIYSRKKYPLILMSLK